MSALLALAERVEAASDNMQGMMLEEAWETLAEHSSDFRAFATSPESGFYNKAGKFSASLEAGAHLSAALMLVPYNYIFGVVNSTEGSPHEAGGGSAFIGEPGEHVGSTFQSSAATPALALTAAALRAKAGQP